MGIIKVLPPTVANQIAAGEVIERPASVIKELIENALDAEAHSIEVNIEDGGRKLIRVIDDGKGMEPDDLQLAFEGHATSKIGATDDLFFITTMGFRGEALASIGAISQAKIISRTRDSLEGAEIEMNGGELGETKARGTPEGTTIEIRNLFHNTPARRKFLKSTQTEMSYITEAVTRMALAYPDVRFRLTHNNRESFLAVPTPDKKERVATFYGRELAEALVEIDWAEGGLRLTGYAAPATHSRSNSKSQFTYLNGRYIRDRTVFRSIADAYRGQLAKGRYPVVFLYLNLDPREVDINVHPTKVEVRFRRSYEIYDHVLAALSDALHSSDLEAQLDALTRPKPEPPTAEPEPGPPRVSRPQGNREFGFACAPPREPGPPRPSPQPSPREFPRPPARESAPLEEPVYERAPFVQIHNSYLVEETPKGFALIDQHALHERVLYQEIRDRMAKANLERQRLLIPETVELSQKEMPLLEEIRGLLLELGVEIEDFGRNTVAIHTLPQILSKGSAADLIHDMLEELAEDESKAASAEARKEAVMKMMACKAAVKAGQKLSPDEIRSLLRKRATVSLADTCPHGRPTMIHFPIDDIEKQFRRK